MGQSLIGAPPRAGVLVVPGNRITEEYIPNTCAALALAGYAVLAPNLFYLQKPGQVRLEGRSDGEFIRDLVAGPEFLRVAHHIGSPLGLVGFCFGGRMALLFANAHPGLTGAVVAYHPGQTRAEEIRGLRAPVEIHIGRADRDVPAEQVRTLEADIKARGVQVETNWYAGADHGFLAYTRPTYQPDAAALSWKRTIEFLAQNLRATT